MKDINIQMVEAIQAGNPESFVWLFETYQKRLFRMAYLICNNEADSEDILQETLIKCFQYRHKLKDPACFDSWLYQILTRTAWRLCKKRKKECPVEQLWQEGQQPLVPSPLETILEHDRNSRLYQAIEGLELKQKTVVILYYYNQLSTKEIAQVTNSLEGTVKSRLFAARRTLKKIWKESQMEVEQDERQTV